MATLLPEPDSPTMPSTSPSSNVRVTPSTACMTLPWVGKSTWRSSISRSGMVGALERCDWLKLRCSRLAFELGVQRIAQPVAQQIEGQHGDQDRQAREGHDPPGAQHELAR